MIRLSTSAPTLEMLNKYQLSYLQTWKYLILKIFLCDPNIYHLNQTFPVFLPCKQSSLLSRLFSLLTSDCTLLDYLPETSIQTLSPSGQRMVTPRNNANTYSNIQGLLQLVCTVFLSVLLLHTGGRIHEVFKILYLKNKPRRRTRRMSYRSECGCLGRRVGYRSRNEGRWVKTTNLGKLVYSLHQYTFCKNCINTVVI